MKRLTRQLLEKSQEAFLLSLEIYNKPTIKYRAESFCFFFINSWELLLKANILNGTGNMQSIFYKKERGKTRRSISLKKALNLVFPVEEDPVRKNIEDIENLRDSATHLIIEEVESIYIGLFQAGVLNYVNYLKSWFGFDITKKISPAMISLMFEIRDINPTILKKKYGKEVLDFFLNKQTEIGESIRALKDNKYCISVEYKFALVKDPKKADILISPQKEGSISGLIFPIPKDPIKTHPYLSKVCINKIKQQVGGKIRFNQYDFQCVAFKEKLRSNPKYYYSFMQTSTYSPEVVEFIVKKIKSNPFYLVKAREYYYNNKTKKDLARRRDKGKK